MLNNPQRASNKGGTFANIFFGLCVLFLTGILITVVMHFSESKRSTAFVAAILSVAGIIFFSWALRLEAKVKNRISFVLLYLMAVLFIIEATRPYEPLIILPEISPLFVDGKFPKLFDTRSKYQVMRDLRKRHVEIYPTFEPLDFYREFSQAFRVRNNYVVPLTNISNSLTALANESGEWKYFISDEHGFNNPKGLYVPGKVDIVLLGPSYVLGSAVEQNENFAGVMREKYPRTLNLGVKDIGPLSQLAVFREYAEPLKPKVVIWFSFEHAYVGNLNLEYQQPRMKAYLDPEYRQDLFWHTRELDQMLKNWLKDNPSFPKEVPERLSPEEVLNRMMMTLQLKRIRVMLGLELKSKYTPPPIPEYLTPTSAPDPNYLYILNLVNEKTKSWGGKLFFVSLPTKEREHEGLTNPYYNPKSYQDRMIGGAQYLKIPVIELYPILISYPDLASLHRFHTFGSWGGHFNEKGYRFVAQAIMQRIEKDVKGLYEIKSGGTK